MHRALLLYVARRVVGPMLAQVAGLSLTTRPKECGTPPRQQNPTSQYYIRDNCSIQTARAELQPLGTTVINDAASMQMHIADKEYTIRSEE